MTQNSIANMTLYTEQKLFDLQLCTIITFIIRILPTGRFLAPILSTLLSPQLFSSFYVRALHKIIYHFCSWFTCPSLPQYSSLQHFLPQFIPSQLVSYPVFLPLAYSFDY